MDAKKCGHCGQIKSISEFNVRSGRVGQYSSWCKSCNRDENRNRPSRKAYFAALRTDPAQIQYKKEYRLKNKAVLCEKQKQRYLANKDAKREYDVVYRQTHKESVKQTTERWHKEHPESRKASWQNRRARKKSNGGTIEAKEWKAMCDFYEHTCLCCGRNDVPVALDHVVPLAVGGQNIIQNAQPLCQSCNSKKHTKTVDYRKAYPSWL